MDRRTKEEQLTADDVADAPTQLVCDSPEAQPTKNVYEQADRPYSLGGTYTSGETGSASNENESDDSPEVIRAGSGGVQESGGSRHPRRSSPGDVAFHLKSPPSFPLATPMSSTPICPRPPSSKPAEHFEHGMISPSKTRIFSKEAIDFSKLTPKKRRLLMSCGSSDESKSLTKIKKYTTVEESQEDSLTEGVESERTEDWLTSKRRKPTYDSDKERSSSASSNRKKSKYDSYSIHTSEESAANDSTEKPRKPTYDSDKERSSSASSNRKKSRYDSYSSHTCKESDANESTDNARTISVPDSQDFNLCMPAQTQQASHDSWTSHSQRGEGGLSEKISALDVSPVNVDSAESFQSHRGDKIYKDGYESHTMKEQKRLASELRCEELLKKMNSILEEKNLLRKELEYVNSKLARRGDDSGDDNKKGRSILSKDVEKRSQSLFASIVVEYVEEKLPLGGKAPHPKVAYLKQVTPLEDLPTAHDDPLITSLTNRNRSSVGSGSDTSGVLADRSSATTSSQVSGPGLFDLPPPQLLSAKSRIRCHDSFASNSSSSLSASHQNGPAKPVCLSCPECKHVFPPVANLNDSPPLALTPSDMLESSTELEDSKLIRRLSGLPVENVATPPTVVKRIVIKKEDSETAEKRSDERVGEAIEEVDQEEEVEAISPKVADKLKSVRKSNAGRRNSRSERKRTRKPTARQLESAEVPSEPPAAGCADEDPTKETHERRLQNAVFAKWTDKHCFYSGYIEKETWDGGMTLYHINYCDGGAKKLGPANVLNAEFVRAGTCAMAKLDGDDFDPCLIMEVIKTKEGYRYKVERENVEKVVSFDNLALSFEVFKELKHLSNTTPTYHMLSNENVMDGKRRRCRSNSSTPPTWKTPYAQKASRSSTKSVDPTTSKGKKSTCAPGQTFILSNIESDGDSTCASLDTRAHFDSPFLDVEVVQDLDEDVRGKLGPTQRSKSFTNVNESREAAEKGPLPKPGSRIFSNCNFVFSYCHYRKRKRFKKDKTLSSSESEQDELKRRPTFPMDVRRLTKQVLLGDGRVYRHLTDVPQEERKSTYLISNGFSRSPMYLQCVLEGVPIFKHEAIIHACIENVAFGKVCREFCESLSIPAGWSDENVRVDRPKSTKPLKQKSVLLALSDPDHEPNEVQFWSGLLNRMDAFVLTYDSERIYKDEIDVIVTDTNCPVELLESKIPVVNCNWVVNTLLHGEFREPSSCPAYHYTYVPDFQDAA